LKYPGTVPELDKETTAIMERSGVDSSDDSTQKKGLETNSGDVYPASARTACAEPLRPFKRNPSNIPQHPFSTPELDYHIVRLGTNPIGSAVYRPLISHLSLA
jgi:hypothetical protein